MVGRWPNARRDLAGACARDGIGRVSPNHLRRTFASWLKQAGVDSMTVAGLLGHTSSRMVELVYGKLNDLTYRHAVTVLPALPERLPELPERAAAGSKWVAKSGGEPGPMRQGRQPQVPKTTEVMVPRGGIEPPTRGFSDLPEQKPPRSRKRPLKHPTVAQLWQTAGRMPLSQLIPPVKARTRPRPPRVQVPSPLLKPLGPTVPRIGRHTRSPA